MVANWANPGATLPEKSHRSSGSLVCAVHDAQRPRSGARRLRRVPCSVLLALLASKLINSLIQLRLILHGCGKSLSELDQDYANAAGKIEAFGIS